jgi:predicted MPP superfamily phosphohydrolase
VIADGRWTVREAVRRALWRRPGRDWRPYLMHDLPYHCMQVAVATAWHWTGSRRPSPRRADRVRVPVRGLPDAFEGFRIVQLSDMHAGPPYPLNDLEQAVALALDEPADLYALTGDFITAWPDDAEPAARLLAPLAARAPAWACAGNHDVWIDWDVVRAALERHGMRVLCNESVALRRGADVLWLAAVDDARHGRPDLHAALADVPAGAPVVLMAHEPDYAAYVTQFERVALQLSGHTHGGQIVVPGRGPLRLPSMGRLYPPGLVRVGRLWLYTSRGVGASWPVRVNAPAEISVIELTKERA